MKNIHGIVDLKLNMINIKIVLYFKEMIILLNVYDVVMDIF